MELIPKSDWHDLMSHDDLFYTSDKQKCKHIIKIFTDERCTNMIAKKIIDNKKYRGKARYFGSLEIYDYI